MAFRGKTIYRSNDGVVAGVCSGFANRLSIDVGVLRFAVVALSLVTFGVFACFYIMLWLLLPSEATSAEALDIRPDSVDSYTYGSVSEREFQHKKAEKAARAHMPPRPPQLDTELAVHQQASGAFVALGLTVGIVLVVVFFAFAASSFMITASPIRFWPLALVLIGIVRVVIPGQEGYRMDALMFGAILVAIGAVLTLHSVGIIFLHPQAWLFQAWPLLFIFAGLLFLWKATYQNGFAIAALLVLFLFCLVGILYCSVYGPMALFLGNKELVGLVPRQIGWGL